MRWLPTALLATVTASCATLSGLDALTAGPSDTDESDGGTSTKRDGSGPNPTGTDGSTPQPNDDGGRPTGIDSGTDAPVVNPGTSLKIEQTKNAYADATRLVTNIAATRSGSLIIVAIGKENQTVTSLTDNAPGGSNTYVAAGYKAVDDGCAVSGEIWYAKDARPGATQITAVASELAFIQSWVIEVSGASPTSPVDVGAFTSNAARANTVVAPPVTPTVPNSLVVSIGVPCDSVSSLQAGSPFTPMPNQQGNSTAYLLATQVGSYGAIWNQSGSVWCASTVAFK